MTDLQKLEGLLGRYLSMRPRSEHEVHVYLQRKQTNYQVDEQSIESLISKYKELGFIDDKKFAESLSHSVIASKAKGKRVLSIKLKQAGIDKDLISASISGIEQEDVVTSMEHRLYKHRNKLGKLTGKEWYYKAYSILLSSGFYSSEIRSFLDESAKKE